MEEAAEEVQGEKDVLDFHLASLPARWPIVSKEVARAHEKEEVAAGVLFAQGGDAETGARCKRAI